MGRYAARVDAEKSMPDLVFLGLLVAFFVASFGLIRFCDRLAGGERR